MNGETTDDESELVEVRKGVFSYKHGALKTAFEKVTVRETGNLNLIYDNVITGIVEVDQVSDDVRTALLDIRDNRYHERREDQSETEVMTDGGRMKPLTPGEKLDLDSGTSVRRGNRSDDALYRLSNFKGHDNRESSILVDRDELRLAAELAGWEVSE